jgi:hypothetical protein
MSRIRGEKAVEYKKYIRGNNLRYFPLGIKLKSQRYCKVCLAIVHSKY